MSARTETPTMELRWARPEKGAYVLQQAYVVRFIDPSDPYVMTEKKEWRCVPVVIVADAPTPPRAERESAP